MEQQKILVIDDEEIIRRVAKKMLQKLGFDVQVANDGRSAIALYASAQQAKHPYDGVIIDLKLEGDLDGGQTFQQLRAIDPDVNAVVSSGDSVDPRISEFTKYGFKAAVIKPYNIEELKNTIYQMLAATEVKEDRQKTGW